MDGLELLGKSAVGDTERIRVDQGILNSLTTSASSGCSLACALLLTLLLSGGISAIQSLITLSKLREFLISGGTGGSVDGHRDSQAVGGGVGGGVSSTVAQASIDSLDITAIHL